MKIAGKVGVNPQGWKGTKKDFTKIVKGNLPKGVSIDEAWEKFQKALPKKEEPKVKGETKDKGGS